MAGHAASRQNAHGLSCLKFGDAKNIKVVARRTIKTIDRLNLNYKVTAVMNRPEKS